MSGGNRPPARWLHGMVYDDARRSFVEFGGWTAGGEVWEKPDETDWTQRSIAGAQPNPRGGHLLVYDPQRNTTLLFGGMSSPSRDHFSDTWEYGPEVQARVTAVGSACLSTFGSPDLAVVPTSWAGYRLFGSVGWPNQFSVPFLMIGLSPRSNCLPFTGSPSCPLRVDPLATIPLTYARQTAQFTLSIPRYRPFWGQTLMLQGGVLQVGVNELGVLLTQRSTR